MSKTAAVVLAVLSFLSFPTASKAQLLPSGNVYGGVGYADNVDVINRLMFRGWEASGEVKLYRWISVAGDVDTNYGSQGFPICQTFPNTGYACSTFSADFIERNFLVGPRVSFHIKGFRPFAEVLVGGAHVNAGVYQGTDNSFAAAVGGGVDAKLTRRFSWRLQGDYLRTQFFGSRQDDGRIATGPVFRF